MELDVSKALLTPGVEFPFTAKVSVPPQRVTGETVTFDEVALSGAFSSMDNVVRMEGNLQTTVNAVCARCLKPVAYPMELSFHETFRRDANELEDEAFHYEGNKVSLDQLTLTLVMLNLPIRFLCQENCDGSDELKAFTQDISKSSCEDGSPTQRPFEALQRLLTKDEEV